jgi:hypothetical protein
LLAVIALLEAMKVVMTSPLTSPWTVAVLTVTVPLAREKVPLAHLRYEAAVAAIVPELPEA